MSARVPVRPLLLYGLRSRRRKDTYDERHTPYKGLRAGESCFRVSGSMDICRYVWVVATRIPASSQLRTVCALLLYCRCDLCRRHFFWPCLLSCAIAARRRLGSTNSEACVYLRAALYFRFPVYRPGGAGAVAADLATVEHHGGVHGARISLAASLDSIPSYWCDCDDATNSSGTASA